MIQYLESILQTANSAAPTFNRIEQAFTAAPIQEYIADTPAAFTMLLEDVPKSANRSMTCVNQEVAEAVGVHLVVPTDRLIECVDFVRAALLGIKPVLSNAPSRSYQRLEFVGGGIDARNGVVGDSQGVQGKYVWWLERYSVTYQIRSR